MFESESSWIEIFNHFLPHFHSCSADLKRGMLAAPILLSQRHRRSRGKRRIPASFPTVLSRFSKSFHILSSTVMWRVAVFRTVLDSPLLSQRRGTMSGCPVDVPVRSRHLHHKFPGCHARGFSRSAHLFNRAKVGRGWMKKPWGSHAG